MEELSAMLAARGAALVGFADLAPLDDSAAACGHDVERHAERDRRAPGAVPVRRGRVGEAVAARRRRQDEATEHERVAQHLGVLEDPDDFRVAAPLGDEDVPRLPPRAGRALRTAPRRPT